MVREDLERQLSRNEVLTEIATFMSGIFFAAILLVYEFQNNLETATIENLTWSLSVSCILFIFLALSCTLKLESDFSLAFSVLLLISAFVSFFISLFLILSLISQTIAITSVILAVVLFLLYLIANLSE